MGHSLTTEIMGLRNHEIENLIIFYILRPLIFHLSLFNVKSRYYKQVFEYPRMLFAQSHCNLEEQLHAFHMCAFMCEISGSTQLPVCDT